MSQQEEISNIIFSLPLICANGRPAKLKKMDSLQLTKFIVYLYQNCWFDSSGNHMNSKPDWWPKNVEYVIDPVVGVTNWTKGDMVIII